MFDLDGTLATSKNPPDIEMTDLMTALLEHHFVGIISGGMYSQLHDQFVSHLSADTQFEHLSILPTSGGSLYQYVHGQWAEKYSSILSPEQKTHIMDALHQALDQAYYVTPETTYGDIIEDRDSQISFSGLGQHAPLTLKETWDPEKTLRLRIINILKESLPDFDCKIGGSTTIDITLKGINKAYGIKKLSESLNIPIIDMLYIGDELEENGNDFVAISSGIATHAVDNPEETKEVIREILKESV